MSELQPIETAPKDGTKILTFGYIPESYGYTPRIECFSFHIMLDLEKMQDGLAKQHNHLEISLFLHTGCHCLNHQKSDILRLR